MKCSSQRTHVGILCSLGLADASSLSLSDTMSFICFIVFCMGSFNFFLRVFCSFALFLARRWKRRTFLEYSLAKPEATGCRDWWILLTFQSYAVRCSSSEKENYFYAHTVFRLKPKEHCTSKYKGCDLRGQTFFISLHTQRLNESNFLLALCFSSVSFLH